MAVALSSSLAFGACTNLDETVYDQLTDSNVDLTTEHDLSLLLGGAVANYRYLMNSWDAFWIMTEMSTDIQMIPSRIGVGWGAQYINLHKHDWTRENAALGASWTYAYQGISYCNLVLDAMGEETEANARLMSHVRFYRALFYYHLFDAFRNVPIQTTQNVPDGYLPEQEGAEAVFNFIVSECDAIKDKIGTPDESYYGYGNKYAVDMLLAKMYLNKNAFLGTTGTEGYEKALEAVNEIIDSGVYSLAANYSDCFQENLNDCPEIIFVIPQSRTHTAQCTWQSYCFPQSGLEAYGSTAAGYNGACAVPQFVKSYDESDKRLAATWAMGAQKKAVQNTDGTYTNNAGDPIAFEADDWSGTGVLTYNIEVHSIDNPGAYQQEGYRLHKYEIVPGGNWGTTATDIPVFRYADALFIKAECLLRLGRDQQTAADLVSKVRARAFASATKANRTIAQLTGSSVYAYGHDEYTSNGYSNWDTHVTTHEGGSDIQFGGLLDDLGWEFAGEFHRRQDLIRFQLTDGRNVYNGKSWFCKDATQETKYNMFPIPNDAMLSNIKLVQNTGY